MRPHPRGVTPWGPTPWRLGREARGLIAVKWREIPRVPHRPTFPPPGQYVQSHEAAGRLRHADFSAHSSALRRRSFCNELAAGVQHINCSYIFTSCAPVCAGRSRSD